MLQKIGNYYLGVIKKYGIVIPVAIVVASFVAMIFLDVFNGLTALVNNMLPLFIILVCVVGLAFAAGFVYTVLKLNSKEIGIQDLGMACLAVIGFLMLIMFLFTGSALFSLLKWLGTATVMLTSLGLGIYRALKVVD